MSNLGLKAKTRNLDILGIKAAYEIDTTTRTIISASSNNTALIQIHTDSFMKLRIRLLENLPEIEQELLQEMYILKDNHWTCGHKQLFFTNNRTRILQANDNNIQGVTNMFVHLSRIFYVNVYLGIFYDIYTIDEKFVRSLPNVFNEIFEWRDGNFISYDKRLLYVPYLVNGEYYLVDYALVITEDLFIDYQVIPGSEHLYDPSSLRGRKRSVFMFRNTVIVITQLGAEYYDSTNWNTFEMNWNNVGEIRQIHNEIHPMVVHYPNGDHLFAFSERPKTDDSGMKYGNRNSQLR